MTGSQCRWEGVHCEVEASGPCYDLLDGSLNTLQLVQICSRHSIQELSMDH